MSALYFLTAALMASTALAAPATSLCTLYDDNYDTLPTLVGAPELSPVGTYHGLKYIDFDVANVVVGNSGFTPHSSPNVAAASFNQDLLSGSVGGIVSPFGQIAIASGVKAFDLKSFYFVCGVADANTVVGLAQSCTIAVTGYYINGQQAPEVTFAFANTNPPTQPMNLALLPATYVGLKNVTFGVVSSSTTATTTIFEMDDLVHCNYS